jgi:hypothetical protein
MVSHRVDATIETGGRHRVEQTFRNHTNQALEATYLFAVPRADRRRVCHVGRRQAREGRTRRGRKPSKPMKTSFAG